MLQSLLANRTIPAPPGTICPHCTHLINAGGSNPQIVRFDGSIFHAYRCFAAWIRRRDEQRLRFDQTESYPGPHGRTPDSDRRKLSRCVVPQGEIEVIT